jgi:hypothetical protein
MRKVGQRDRDLSHRCPREGSASTTTGPQAAACSVCRSKGLIVGVYSTVTSIRGGRDHRVGQRADGENGRLAAASQHREPVAPAGQGSGVSQGREPQVHQCVVSGCCAQQRFCLVGVAGNVHNPPGQRAQQGHVARRLMCPARR